MKNMIFLSILLLLLSSCNNEESIRSFDAYQEICGRDNGSTPYTRTPIYRAKVPYSWKRIDSEEVSISDSTKSLCEFRINDSIRITIHNFPVNETANRIPPLAQVERWKRQFKTLEYHQISQQAFAGFLGLLFEGKGVINEKEVMVMAWAMQLAPEHISNLQIRTLYKPKEKIHFQQMSADYTIKVLGSEEEIMNNRNDIIAFARSFELIEEI